MGMGRFPFLVIVSNAAMNMGVQISDQIPAVIPYRYIPSNGSAGHMAPLLSLLSFGVPHQFAFLYLRDVKVTHQTCLLLCFIDKHANVSLLPALSHRDDSPGRSTYQPTDNQKLWGPGVMLWPQLFEMGAPFLLAIRNSSTRTTPQLLQGQEYFSL